MTANRDLERRVADYYAAEPPLQAPDRVLRSALSTIDITRQQRAPIRAPWRFTDMSTYTKVAAAAVVAIAVGAIGLWQLAGTGGPASTPIPSVTPAPTQPASPTPDPSPAPALTETYTSVTQGISIAYPSGWATRAATTPWTDTAGPRFDSSSADFIYHPAREDHLFVGLVSQPLAGRTGPAWAESVEADSDWDACPSSETIVVDGIDGRLVSCTEPLRVVTWDDARGYLILLYRSGDEGGLEQVYDLDWFREILATVQLHQPVPGTAATFVWPFDYVLPTGPEFAFGVTNETYWEVRVPAWADAGYPGGLIMQAIGGGRVDPCDKTSAVLPLEWTTVFEYLGTIPGMTVSDLAPTTVDGRPAQKAMVRLESTTDCPVVWAWVEATESFIDGHDLRLVAVDVAWESIVVSIYGEADNPGWPLAADGIVSSFRFQRAE